MWKQIRRSDSFSITSACNFKNTSPVLFMFFKWYKWYQIAQSITDTYSRNAFLQIVSKKVHFWRETTEILKIKRCSWKLMMHNYCRWFYHRTSFILFYCFHRIPSFNMFYFHNSAKKENILTKANELYFYLTSVWTWKLLDVFLLNSSAKYFVINNLWFN